MNKMVSDALKDIMLNDMIEISKIIIAVNGVQVVKDNKIGAMAWTTGDGIFINEQYIKDNNIKLNKNNIIFLICHEALHILTLTFNRKENRNHLLWNMASDYAINQILVDERIGTIIDGGLQDNKYRDLSAEKIYEKLLQDKKSKNNNGGNGKNNDGNGNGQAKINCDGQEIVMDDHSQLEKISDQEKESLSVRAEDILKASSRAGSKLSQRILNIKGKNKINWKIILNKFIKSFISSNYSWRMPSKRSVAINQYLPKVFKSDGNLKVAVGVDTSGSVGEEELNKFFYNLLKIMSVYKSYEIDVHCFSTEVHKNTIKTFKKSNSKDLFKYKPDTNFGTNINSSFAYIDSVYKKKKYDCFICMTDGCDNIENIKFNKCPVVWGIIGNDDFTSNAHIKNQIILNIDKEKLQ